MALRASSPVRRLRQVTSLSALPSPSSFTTSVSVSTSTLGRAAMRSTR